VFGLSMAEVAVVAVVALIFLGPDKLPVVMRGLAKVYRQLARLRTEFSKAVADNLGPELGSLKPEMERLADWRVDLKKPVPTLLADKAKEAVLGAGRPAETPRPAAPPEAPGGPVEPGHL
jgi:sec-independent protein translocase protein TatB